MSVTNGLVARLQFSLSLDDKTHFHQFGPNQPVSALNQCPRALILTQRMPPVHVSIQAVATGLLGSGALRMCIPFLKPEVGLKLTGVTERYAQGKCLYTLKDHAHWVTTLALNTDFVLRTGPFDHTNKKPVSDAEGMLISHFPHSMPICSRGGPDQLNSSPRTDTPISSKPPPSCSSPAPTTTRSSCGLYSPRPRRLRASKSRSRGSTGTSGRSRTSRFRRTDAGSRAARGTAACAYGTAGRARSWRRCGGTWARCTGSLGARTRGWWSVRARTELSRCALLSRGVFNKLIVYLGGLDMGFEDVQDQDGSAGAHGRGVLCRLCGGQDRQWRPRPNSKNVGACYSFGQVEEN